MKNKYLLTVFLILLYRSASIGVPNAIAILVGGNSVKNTNRLIKLNEIKLHDFAQHGIFGNAVYGYIIDHNYINLYNANNNLTGISLTQGRQCTLNCNSISGTGNVFTYDQQAAMWFQDSPENTISCNTVQKTYTGIGFMGTCIGVADRCLGIACGCDADTRRAGHDGVDAE